MNNRHASHFFSRAFFHRHGLSPTKPCLRGASKHRRHSNHSRPCSQPAGSGGAKGSDVDEAASEVERLKTGPARSRSSGRPKPPPRVGNPPDVAKAQPCQLHHWPTQAEYQMWEPTPPKKTRGRLARKHFSPGAHPAAETPLYIAAASVSARGGMVT